MCLKTADNNMNYNDTTMVEYIGERSRNLIKRPSEYAYVIKTNGMNSSALATH